MDRNKLDFYIQHKNTFIKLRIPSCILFAIFLILTIVFGGKLNNVHADYQKVTVTVISTSHIGKLGNEVYVEYNNEKCQLINVTDSEYSKYKVHRQNGTPVEVLLGNDGKLYSNTDGIRTNTAIGKLYFVFLTGTILFLIAFIMLYACVVEANKREKGIYPQ